MRKSESTKRAVPRPTPQPAAGLTDSLRALDEVLAIAVDRQARLLGPASLLDPWRGMHLDQADVQRLVERGSHAALFGEADASVSDVLAQAMRSWPRAAQVADELKLGNIELAALLITIAPDLDLRYERIFAYLQDDIARKRPALDLIANLLARDAAERLTVCACFGAASPLLRFGVFVCQGSREISHLARPWRVDELWRGWLLGEEDMSTCIDEHARVMTVFGPPLDQLPIDAATLALIRGAIAARRARVMPLRVLAHGPHGSGKLLLAHAIAAAIGQKLLVLDLRDCAGPLELRGLVRRAQRGAVLSNAVLYLHGIGRIEQRDPQMLRALLEVLGASSCNFILSLTTPLPAMHADDVPLLRIELRYPTSHERAKLWRCALAARGLDIDDECESRLTSRFALSAPQIYQAAAELQAVVLSSDSEAVAYEAVAAVARMQCGTELARIAQRIAPRADFAALVVPHDVLAQLREICARISTRETVGREWSDGSVHSRGVGVTALFVGPSGTGKTLAAEALARELGLDLYRIDLAGIVSKYIGETEKNLDRVFAAAENANAVLFFDEADALFGKRSEVKDAHDRYANIEVAYLLQKMEQFDGLAILATNLKQNLDDAFARRLTFTINFPFPEEAERRALWERLWPPRAPRDCDVDLDWFAREFRMSGGNIRNIVLAAAHLAAADGKVVTREHLLHATRREYQKLGKNLARPDAGERRVS